MEERRLVKLELIIPLLAAVMIFLVQKEVLEITVYAVPALILALYFFPVKMFLVRVVNADGVDNRYWYLFSNFIFSLMLANSVYQHLSADLPFLRYALIFLSFINIALAVFYYLSGKSRRYVYLHLGFILFASAAV